MSLSRQAHIQQCDGCVLQGHIPSNHGTAHHLRVWAYVSDSASADVVALSGAGSDWSGGKTALAVSTFSLGYVLCFVYLVLFILLVMFRSAAIKVAQMNKAE